eukprot:TRINITY_DN18746_c0_g1_i1.p1 TRINITY_DN18746_c0_g1~~TRINITY_DN18746_c0_g1_i1.p1  ORF type:complete len:770 (-),score=200.95 TRINITY_DN18746_c0_g1_i1:45-2117(-)
MFLYKSHPYLINPPPDGPHNDWSDIAHQVLRSMNRSVDPCVDFYEYSCGYWLSNTSIPPDKVSWNRAYDTLTETTYQLLKNVLTNENPPVSTINKFYSSCMAKTSTDTLGVVPLYTTYPFLYQVDALQMSSEASSSLSSSIAELVGQLHRHKIFVFYAVDAKSSISDPSQVVLQIDQAPLSLGEHVYYLEPAYDQLRMRFVDHVAKVLDILGVSSNRFESALQVLELEKYLASKSITSSSLSYQPLTLFELKDLSPDWSWDTYFRTIGVDPSSSTDSTDNPTPDPIQVFSNSFFAALSPIFKPIYSQSPNPTFPLKAVQAYIKYRIAAHTSVYLNSELQQEFFNLNKILFKVPEQISQEKHCLEITNSLLGDLVGEKFVSEVFPPSAFYKARNLVNNMKTAWELLISNEAWMDQETRVKATEKLHDIYIKIGYSSNSSNHESLRKIQEETFFANAMEALSYNFDISISQIKQRRSVTQWRVNPQTITTFYDPSFNEIVVPAGILQGNYFNEKQPSALNYGAIGSLISHELTHVIDQIGNKFDKDGKFSNWWSEDLFSVYESKTSCLSDQYKSKTNLIPKFNENLTLTENIADNSALRVSYQAFKNYLNSDAKLQEDEDGRISAYFEGLTNDKLFFVGYAQLWCTLYRDPNAMVFSSQAPGRWRTNIPTFNLEEFRKTFGCKTFTSPCRVW